MSLLKEILDAKDLTSYEVGLLQTKAYRVLKERTGKILEPFSMTSTEWAFLGTLHDHKDGVRAGDLANILGVEAPFVTALYKKFLKRKLLTKEKDPKDVRAKILTLTPEGHALVKEVEAILRKEGKKWLSGVGIREVLSYIKVLKTLTQKDI